MIYLNPLIIESCFSVLQKRGHNVCVAILELFPASEFPPQSNIFHWALRALKQHENSSPFGIRRLLLAIVMKIISVNKWAFLWHLRRHPTQWKLGHGCGTEILRQLIKTKPKLYADANTLVASTWDGSHCARSQREKSSTWLLCSVLQLRRKDIK